MTTILKFIQSNKKASATIGGVLVVVLVNVFDMDKTAAEYIVGLIMAYVVGQGIADHGKEKAKIENGNGK